MRKLVTGLLQIRPDNNIVTKQLALNIRMTSSFDLMFKFPSVKKL